jgi:hypothetical protein
MKTILSYVAALSLLFGLLSHAEAIAGRKGGHTPRESTAIDREPDEGTSRRSTRRERARQCRGFMEDSSSGEGLRGFIEPGLYDSGDRGNSEP